MTDHPEDDDLAQQVHGVMRELPLRVAPATLESRVLAALARRGGLPWWRRGFAVWPVAARSVFFAICGSLIGFTFLYDAWANAGSRVLNRAGALSMAWAQPAVTLMSAAGQLSDLLLRTIPSAWLYAAMTAGALLYAALIGLGAAAYRALYVSAGDIR